MKTLRIFVSSPGDVGRERQTAGKVIRRVEASFGRAVKLDPYFWEDEPMRGQGDFQDSIDDPAEFDLVVCILWSRLGSRLHQRHQREDGSGFASGTEYEFERALAGWRQKRSPDLLVYRRSERPLFPPEPEEELLERHRQWKALKEFFEKWFVDSQEGVFTSAFNSYANLAEFEDKLEHALRKLVAERIPAHPDPTAAGSASLKIWTGESPYRGMQVFDAEHEPIFFGRTRATDEVLGQLRARATTQGTPFVLIYGASGSGKSSLLRAGVLPLLVRPGVIEGIGLWRWVVLKPSDSEERAASGPAPLFRALARALLAPTALPEIGSDGTTIEALAQLLDDHSDGAVLLIKEALSRTARETQMAENLARQPVARLALGLDQLEELFTLSDRFRDEDLRKFCRTIHALVRSGFVWVVGTLRSDFFPQVVRIPELAELSARDGQFLLPPPTATELGQMVRQPAQASGVRFEEDPAKGRLDDVIRDAALQDPGALALLEFALDELFRAGAEAGILTHAVYERIGGVRGALGRRADALFASLPAEAQAALGAVLRRLVTIRLPEANDTGRAEANAVAARRTAPLEELTQAVPAARQLVDHFISGRLFVGDRGPNGEAVVMVAHEELLRSWPPARDWIREHAELLKLQAEVAAAESQWTRNGRTEDYLLPGGLPLEKARRVRDAGFLGPPETGFVNASVTRAEAGARAALRRARRLAGVFAGISLVVIAIATYGFWQRARAVKARAAAESLVQFLTVDMREMLAPIGRLYLMSAVNQKTAEYYRKFGAGDGTAATIRRRAHALSNRGDELLERGELGGALAAYQEENGLLKPLAARSRSDPDLQMDLARSSQNIGAVFRDQGRPAEALAAYRAAAAIHEELTARNPSNPEWQHALSVSYDNVGDLLRDQGDLVAALNAHRDAEAIRQALLKANPTNSQWLRALSVSHERVGTALESQGDLTGALEEQKAGLKIREQLVSRDPAQALWRRDLAASQEKLGDVFKQQGELDKALDCYHSAEAIVRQLTDQDPMNAVYRRHWAAARLRVGGIHESRGKRKNAPAERQAALAEYQDALAEYQAGAQICQILAKQNPENVLWQRDLAISYERLGDALCALERLPEALTAYRTNQDILGTLTNSVPVNPQWQHDLVVSYDKLGGLLRLMRDRKGATEAYRTGEAIAQRLVSSERFVPPEWRADLAFLQAKLGFLASTDEPPRVPEARRLLTSAREILHNLIATRAPTPQQRQVIEDIESELSRLPDR